MAIKINGVTVIDDNRAGNLASAVATGNIAGGNITTAGQVVAVGNISGNFFLGNGSQLTGIDATSIQNGSANVRTFLNGNVTVSAAGTANVMTVTGTGANITGTVNATGNANVGNLGATNAVLAGALSGVTTISASGNANVGNLGATNVVATNLTGTLQTAAQTNITSLGTLTALGVTGNITGGNLLISNNAVISGNLTVQGTETIFNVQTLTVNDKDIVVANNVTGGANINGAGLLAGNPTTASFVYDNATTSWQVNVALTPNANGTLDLGKTGSRWGNAFLSTLTSTGNANVGNLGATNAVLAGALSGVTTISASGNANVGNLGATNVVATNLTGTLQTAAQTNITSVGTLGSLTVTGNVSGGNLTTSGAVTGNGRALTSLNASNIDTGTLAQARLANAAVTLGSTALTLGATVTTVAGLSSVTSTTFVGALTGAATTAGTVTTAAQPNITSVGTLTSVTVTGNVAAGNLSGTNIVGTLTTAAQTNITSVGTLSALTVTGNVGGGNLNSSGVVTGNGRPLTNLNASNIDTGTLAQARLANASLTVNGTSIALGGSGTVTANTTQVLTFNNAGSGGASGTTFNGGTAQTISYNSIGAPSTTGTNASGTWSISVTGSAGTAATVTTAAQPNITSVGTLTALTVTGNVTGGNLITAGLVSLSSITKTGSNGVGNIGASTSTFNTVFARATSAQYADLAEMYEADADYEPGWVVSFGGNKEITQSTVIADTRVAGVISTQPAHLMNSALAGEHVLPVALAGRVPTRVTGPVRKGDMMVSAGDGTACACSAPQLGSVIGKSLEDHGEGQGMIEVVVGRL
jgi:hypothetical protein